MGWSEIAEDGSYSFKTFAKEEGLYLITSIDHKPFFIFINDTCHVLISADLKNSTSSPNILNSDATKSLYECLNRFHSIDSSVAEIYNEVDSLSKQNPNSANIVALQNNGTKMLQLFTSYTKEFIEKSNSPAAVYYVLNVLSSKNIMSSNEISFLAQDASNRFKNHSGLIAFKNLFHYP